LAQKREYLNGKINDLETNSRSNSKTIQNLHRGINEFKKGFQARNNLVKDKNGDLLADTQIILKRWNFLSYQS
jgi:hypothetical protein